MNVIGKKWMAADLYEKCLICDEKGHIYEIGTGEEMPCPECEGIGFMLIGMTMEDLERLKARVEGIDKSIKVANAIKAIADMKADFINFPDPPWIPVIGDRVRSKAHGAIGTITRVFRGEKAGFQPDKLLIDVEFDNGGRAHNFDPGDFELLTGESP